MTETTTTRKSRQGLPLRIRSRMALPGTISGGADSPAFSSLAFPAPPSS